MVHVLEVEKDKVLVHNRPYVAHMESWIPGYRHFRDQWLGHGHFKTAETPLAEDTPSKVNRCFYGRDVAHIHTECVATLNAHLGTVRRQAAVLFRIRNQNF